MTVMVVMVVVMTQVVGMGMDEVVVAATGAVVALLTGRRMTTLCPMSGQL